MPARLHGFFENRTRTMIVLWSIVRKAADAGMKWYDFGGIDPGSNPGVYRFKVGLGGVDVQAARP